MLKELFSFVLGLKRDVLIQTIDGQYIYNASRKQYDRVPENRPFNRSVCNIDSFASAVIEELHRFANLPTRDATVSGKNKTVIFEKKGGTFYTDDLLKKEQDTWEFQREFTTLWKVVEKLISSQKVTHLSLLEAIDSVKTFIPGFENLYRSLSKLRLSKKTSFISSPIYAGDGFQGGGYEWDWKIDSNGVTEKAVCPAEIPFKGRLVRGSEQEYGFALSLTPAPDETKGEMHFSLSMPGFDLVMDQIREDDYNRFLTTIKGAGVENLLILRNY